MPVIKKGFEKIYNSAGFSCEGCQHDILLESVLGLGTSAVTTIATHNPKYGIVAGGLMMLLFYPIKHQFKEYYDKMAGWNHKIPY